MHNEVGTCAEILPLYIFPSLLFWLDNDVRSTSKRRRF